MGASAEQLDRFKEANLQIKTEDAVAMEDIVSLHEIVAQLNNEKDVQRMSKLLIHMLASSSVFYVSIAGEGNFPNYIRSQGGLEGFRKGSIKENDQFLTVENGKIIVSLLKFTKKKWWRKPKKYFSPIIEIDICPSIIFSLMRSSASYAIQTGFTLYIKQS